MTFVLLWVISVFRASNEFLAEPTSKPRTKAARVAIVPATTFTVSLELSRRWCSGIRPCSNKPSKAPPKMHPALIKKMVCGLVMQLYRLVLLLVSPVSGSYRNGSPFTMLVNGGDNRYYAPLCGHSSLT